MILKSIRNLWDNVYMCNIKKSYVPYPLFYCKSIFWFWSLTQGLRKSNNFLPEIFNFWETSRIRSKRWWQQGVIPSHVKVWLLTLVLEEEENCVGWRQGNKAVGEIIIQYIFFKNPFWVILNRIPWFISHEGCLGPIKFLQICQVVF